MCRRPPSFCDPVRPQLTWGASLGSDLGAPGKLGRLERVARIAALKLRMAPCVCESRPVKVGHQPEARSVDSECVGRVTEPRNDHFVGADVFRQPKAVRNGYSGLVFSVPPGSKSRACIQEGSPGTCTGPEETEEATSDHAGLTGARRVYYPGAATR